MASALLTGIEAYPAAQGEWRWLCEWAERALLAVFVLELLVRIGAHWPKPWEYFDNGWAVFDFVLVALMFLPATQFLAVLRLVRLLRILRLIVPLHESDVVKRKNAELEKAYHDLELEKERSEHLLLNILPRLIADRLKQNEAVIADHFEIVSVLFVDIVGFTQLSQKTTPEAVVGMLNDIFTRFDVLTERYGLEKIKTIGDCYMVTAGVPVARDDHAHAIANMALDLREEITSFNTEHETTLAVRIGFHSGPVVAGVIGRKKFVFDIWGDTVNTASRMESHGTPGKIQVTRETFERLWDDFVFTPHGVLHVKGKGDMETFFLERRRAAAGEAKG